MFCTVLQSIIILLIFLKIYSKFTCGRCQNANRLDGKTVLITGCTAGIGKATAFDLARRGARIVMGCRDLDKSRQVIDEIKAKTGNHNLVVHQLELESFASIREFAKTVNASETRLDILINNAGINSTGRKRTEDGFSKLLQVNHLGPFLLTNLLLDLLKKSAPSRIINVSSALHHIALLHPENLEKNFTILSNTIKYSNTKLCNVLISNYLADSLHNSGVTVNSLHPGLVATDINRNLKYFDKIFNGFVFNFYGKSIEEGAQTTIYLATSEDQNDVTGKYFSDCRVARHRGQPKTRR